VVRSLWDVSRGREMIAEVPLTVLTIVKRFGAEVILSRSEGV
jgi:hypothetical protein